MTDVVHVDDRALPRRKPKGLLPSTWQGRSVTLEYQTGDNHSVTLTGATLVELYPAGPVLSKDGGLQIVSWDRIILIELAGV